MSGTHASLRERDAGYVLIDEGSTNGTRINEIRLAPGRPKTMRSHDLVDLGGYRLSIEIGVPVARPTSPDTTAEHARRLLAEHHPGETEEAIASLYEAIQQAPDEHVELLPIPNSAESEPPPPSEPGARAPAQELPVEPVTLGRSEVAVYALAALVVASSIVAMALLSQP